MVNKNKEDQMNGTSFIVKVFSPVSGELGCEKLFSNLVEAIEYKIAESHAGGDVKIYHLVEFEEVS